MRAVTYDSYAEDNSRLTVGAVTKPELRAEPGADRGARGGGEPRRLEDHAGRSGRDDGHGVPVGRPELRMCGRCPGAVGPDVPEFSVGDEVMAYARKDVVHAGTFAELVAVAAVVVARKPATLDWQQAGGLPLAGLTALRTLDRLAVGPSDTVLLHGAAGGVGSMAVQIARGRGARVLGTASEGNHARLRELGAEPVTYGEGLADRVRDLAPGGVTAVGDFVGGQLETTLAVLATGGRHASVADPSVEDHGGAWIWVRPDGTKLAELAELCDRAGLTVDVAGTFALDEVSAAFDLSRAGHTHGKLVIVP